MIFGEFRCEDALGVMLAHTLEVGTKTLRKGRVLDAPDLALLRDAGIGRVSGARLERDDVAEGAAAAEIAALLAGPNTATSTAGKNSRSRAARHHGGSNAAAQIATLPAAQTATSPARTPPRISAVPDQLGSAVSVMPTTIAAAKPNSSSWPCHRDKAMPADGTRHAPRCAPAQAAISTMPYSAPTR